MFSFLRNNSSATSISSPSSVDRLENIGFYLLLITIILAPLAFWPSRFISIELVKTVLISLGTIISALIYGVVAFREKKLSLPPKAVLISGILVMLSVVVSSLTSGHISKSFFGQGFELGTASLTLILFLSGLVSYNAIVRRPERAIIVYAGSIGSFICVFVFHLLRIIFGSGFASLGFLQSVTSTVVGNWYDISIYAIVVLLISFIAILLLPLSRRMKMIYWVIFLLAAVATLTVNYSIAWSVSALVLLGLTILLTSIKPKTDSIGVKVGFIRRIAWLPLILFVIAGIFSWYGTSLVNPVLTKINAGYSQLTLPWQLTLDVTSGVIKDHPLLGVGPNRFTQAYIDYKPAIVNSTDAWGVEFNSGFGLIPTFIVTQGIVGAILWMLFFVFLGMIGIRALRNLPNEPQSRFLVISSFITVVFLWIMTIVSVPSHSILFITFVMTGVFLAGVVSLGQAQSKIIAPALGSRMYSVFSSLICLLIVIGIVWGLIYVKKTVALAYFASGVKAINIQNDADAAGISFSKATSIDASDIYWQAREEAGLIKANKLASSITSSMSASTSQAILSQVASIVNESISFAHNAIAVDPSNYYNYISEARVSEAATNLHMDNGYENAVKAYMKAIELNPKNPSLYLSLARLYASQNKLDEALKTVGAAIQVKNNYLDAVFLLSQIEAAQGNLKDAIIAAQVATQINPQNPVLFFQLGLLYYSGKDYNSAVQAFGKAVSLQSNYANAQYFLGLSQVRIGKNSEAIEQFEQLAVSNPDNQEVKFILENLKSGKSPFADAKPPVTPNPETRPSLPIKENKAK